MAVKHLTLLHSNDMHGDFLAENAESGLIGGISLLSGYIRRIRKENPDTLFAIAGDMFKGSVIDSEYRGFSTIDLMNYLHPDVVSLGNHEADYGLAHLLFLEKCAKFPVVNANVYIKTNLVRLFHPYCILETGGMRVMFIGIITEEVLASAKSEAVVGSFVDVHEAAAEVAAIADSYRTADIDLTVLLTHIGYEEDKKLAAALDPGLGIDLIIGGHSHTLLKKPKVINSIPIVQVGTGTDQIGRFDIEIDTEQHSVLSCSWQVIPISSETSVPDPVLDEVLKGYREETDRKYQRVLNVLDRKLVHASRAKDSELGSFFADLLQKDSSFDVMFYGTGSIRAKSLGPLVRFKDLRECIPFDNSIYMLEITGEQMKRMCTHYISQSIETGGSSEFYQVSQGVHIVYNAGEKKLETLEINGKPAGDDERIRIGIQEFALNNFEEFMGVSLEEITAARKPRMVATNEFAIFAEMLVNEKQIMLPEGERITIKD